ncbi:MAG: ATP synthase F1 subunit gamma [Clostridia bacterium]|nr:ATP synthase F1 subunit gamma [Clostridia bacterium]
MSFDTKALKNRIKSVDSTLHLTKAMELVASSKIRKANINMAAASEYSGSVENVIALLSGSRECKKSPFLKEPTGDKTLLLAIAGDRGLAGGYNVNIFRFLRDYENAEILPIGKRACERYGRGYASSEKFSSADAAELSKRLCTEFLEGKFDRLGIVYTRYVSMMLQTPDIKWILPIERTKDSKTSVIFEPDEVTVLGFAVPEYVSGVIMGCVRESFACEVAARRMAMDNAGKNARQIIDDLQIKYNRARQGAITQEITEIVAGSGQQ